MARSLLWLARLLGVVATLGFGYALWRLGDTGSFEPIAHAPPSACQTLLTGIAITDADYDPQTQTAYLAGLDETAPDTQGTLLTLDLHAAQGGLKRIALPELRSMNPSGLALYRNTAGARLLFVTDRRADSGRVEILSVDGTVLSRRETIADPSFRSLNDIVAIGPRQFFVSNDHRARSLIGRLIERFFGLPVSDVVHFDGTLGDPAISGLESPRGLAIAPDGTTIYVAERLSHRVRVFRRAQGNALKEERSIPLPGVPDKMSLDPSGHLIVALQPRLFRLFAAVLGHVLAPPSYVLRIDPATGTKEPIYFDDGELISDTRVALATEQGLLLGSVKDRKLMLCTLN